MEPIQDQAPISVDVEEAFDRDLSGLDIPDHDGAASDSQPAAKVPTEEAEPVGDDEEVKEEQEQAPEVASAKPAAKQVAFKIGDKKIDLQEDAVIDWKVDGKQTPVALKDLLANYSGKVAWEKRFNEVAEQRKQFAEISRSFESEKARHSAVINDMHKAASEGRTFDAVTAMLKLTGTKASPREYIANLRNGLMKQAEEMSKLTPEQRQIFEEREELAYQKSEISLDRQQREQEQADRAFQSRVVKAIGSVNSTVDEYVSTRDFLLEQGPKLLGNAWNPKDVTPEYIANHIRDVRDHRTAKEALDAVDPELVKNETVWKQAVEFLRSNPGWTADDLKDIYREATKTKRATAVSQKVAKAPQAPAATAKIKQSKTSSREDFSSFDEADAEW